MSSHRSISWSSALRDLRADRTAHSPIREERLRTTRYASGPLILSAWRGRSGRRYVVVVEPVTATDLGDAVVIAVARDAVGIATILAIGTIPAGATELHIHRLAETPAARAAVASDLTPDVLGRMADLLARPEAWTRKASARDAAGVRVDAANPTAVCWDIGGALDRVAAGNVAAADAAEHALLALALHPMGLAGLNDDATFTHADLLSLLQAAQRL